MIKINFPGKPLPIKKEEGNSFIFDVIRKKWLRLTPEEWVRQNVLQFLLEKKYPASLIAVEKEIKLGELSKRCDIVVYDRALQPWMIIECKEMNVPLSHKTISQVLRYHLALPATFLIITNGVHCFGAQKEKGQFFEIDLFPEYDN